jgi:hypothetical protein
VRYRCAGQLEEEGIMRNFTYSSNISHMILA